MVIGYQARILIMRKVSYIGVKTGERIVQAFFETSSVAGRAISPHKLFASSLRKTLQL